MKLFHLWVVKLRKKLFRKLLKPSVFQFWLMKPLMRAKWEQLSLSLRFVKSNSLHKEFFSFVLFFFCSIGRNLASVLT